MTKILFAVIVFAITINFGNAQEQKFGIIGGANYSSYIGDLSNNAEISRRLSFHLGVSSEFQLSNKVSFAPRIMYSSQGFNDELAVRMSFDATPSNLKIAQRINFINIPVLMNFYFLENFGIQFGPQIGFLLNSVGVVKDNGENENIEEGAGPSVEGDFKLDYGLRLALFYKFSEKLHAELGYYHGFSNITRNEIGDYNNNNTVFQLSLGYLLF